MLIDGKVDYACTVRLKQGLTTLRAVAKEGFDPGSGHGNRATG